MPLNFKSLPKFEGVKLESSSFGCNGCNNDGSIMIFTLVTGLNSKMNNSQEIVKKFKEIKSIQKDQEVVTKTVYVYISKDYGTNWSIAYTYVDNSEYVFPYSVSINPSGKYIVITLLNGLIISTDGGVDWKYVKLSNQSVRPTYAYGSAIGKEITENSTLPYIYISAFMVVKQNSENNYFEIVLRSIDGCQTFEEIKRIPWNNFTYTITAATKHEDVYLLGYDYLYFSRDNGETWNTSSNDYIYDIDKTNNIKTSSSGSTLVSSTYDKLNLFVSNYGVNFTPDTNLNGLLVPSRSIPMGPTITGNGAFMVAATTSLSSDSDLQIFLDSSGTGNNYSFQGTIPLNSAPLFMSINNSNSKYDLIILLSTETEMHIVTFVE